MPLLATFVVSVGTYAAELRTVALSGQLAPGTSPGVEFHSIFSAPELNSAGQTAFTAQLTGIELTMGVWSEANGSLALVAKTGDLAPGTPAGVNFGTNLGAILNSQGQIVLTGTLTGGGVTTSNDFGIWSDRSGALTLVAREGDQAPGTPSGTAFSFTNFDGPVFNSAGQIAFSSRLEGTSSAAGKDALWSERSGALSLVALGGQQAPGSPDGANFVGDFSRPVLDAAGQTAFSDRLTFPIGSSGVWSDKGGTLGLIARAGDSAPGTAPGTTFVAFGDAVLNSAGRMTFGAFVEKSGVPNSGGGGIWSVSNSSLELIVRSGDVAPGAPAGFEFLDFEEQVMNSSGQIAFKADISNVPANFRDSSIWKEVEDGSLMLIAKVGQHAPGTPANVNFLRFSDPVLNAVGQVAFLGTVEIAGMPRGNHVGIWAEDLTGNLQMIARVGDLLKVAPNDFRTIFSLNFIGGSGNEDGRPSGFNDNGQLAFNARFTDGSSGIFVSNLVAIPEPTAARLVAVSVTMLLLRGNRLRASTYARARHRSRS